MKVYKKIKKKLPSAKLMFEMWWANRTQQQPRTFDPSANVHVSLTSYGKRIDKVYFTIESIMRQSADMSSITLYLYREDIKQSGIPKSLARLQKRGLRIELVDQDLRSYKKLYYAYLEHFNSGNSEARLVTADDDVFYSETWLAKLLEGAEQHPDKVIAYRGHTISLNADGQMQPYREWKDGFDNERFLPTGVAGVLYPIASLKNLEKQSKEFMSLCAFADDLWFKCLTLSNGYLAHQVEDCHDSNPPAILTLNTKRRGLALYNVHQGGNDVQMRNTVEYFSLSFA